MKRFAFALALFGVLITAPLFPATSHAQDGMIRPFTKGAFETLQMLKEAAVADRMNSHAWTSDNPTLDAFYAAKAHEVQQLIDRLEKHEPVLSVEVERALDTRGARRLSGEFWDVPDVPSHY